MTFRTWFYRTDPQNIGGQFGTLSGFLRNTFRKGTSQRKPEIYFRAKSFRTIFEKRAPVYSLEAPFLGMAKSIYYSARLFHFGNRHHHLLASSFLQYEPLHGPRFFIQERAVWSFLFRMVSREIFSDLLSDVVDMAN